MKKIYDCIDRLVRYAEKNLGLDARNATYARNTVFGILGLDSYGGGFCGDVTDVVPDALLAELDDSCVSAGLFGADEAEKYNDAVMGALMLLPAEVNDRFAEIAEKHGSEKATAWLYDYSVKCDYVKKSKLDSNPRFDANGLVITVNKAKPEFRDPKKAASGNSTACGYPKCTICRENEGFFGRSKRTLRTVDIKLGGENWFWQFSPYGYFREHGIAVNSAHVPMHIDGDTFVRLIDFVDIFPHYFIGCNAPLPRIGRSVLAHDHYQGGGESLPLHKAGEAISLKSRVADVKIGVLDWPGTAVRVTGSNKSAVAEASERLGKAWTDYRNDELGIINEDGDGMHSAVSPTAVKTIDGYEMTVVLRNNITSEKYPDGVFHAHPEFHAVKKESIGLIEAQGLFILPGRLVGQLSVMEECLTSGKSLPGEFAEFGGIYEELKTLTPHRPTEEQAREAIKKELGSVCRRILENTAVFKTHKQTAEFLTATGVCLQ